MKLRYTAFLMSNRRTAPACRPGRHGIRRHLLGVTRGLVILSVFLVVGVRGSDSAGGLQFELILEKQEYKLSEPIEIGFRLRNSGKEPVVVNKRFKLGSEKAAPQQKEVVLAVRSGDGSPVEMKNLDYETGFPKSEYFELLENGEEAVSERTWNLKDLAKIEKPGTYEVTAAYQNVFGKELGLDVFREKVAASAQVKVAGE